ncbi:MAG: SUMF1/EgtB/PvdO family nonheme iron enzyme [Deltaproteobacteria bacterium]|nr:SUMF1/EgtB/PvdO family nonheme iron enzyme [Deltaproteobacteria bacterium]
MGGRRLRLGWLGARRLRRGSLGGRVAAVLAAVLAIPAVPALACRGPDVEAMRFSCDPARGDAQCGAGCRCIAVSLQPYPGVCRCEAAPLPDAGPDEGGDEGCGESCEAVEPEPPCQGGWCRVPAGPFRMGCDAASDAACGPDEGPQHEVILAAFEIGRLEVGVEEYAACQACGPAGTGPFCNAGEAGRGGHPVNCVTWDQAAAYCEWIGRRLCTEAEWEKAARGGCELHDGCAATPRLHPWGDAPPADAAATAGAPVGNLLDAAAVTAYPGWAPGIPGYDDGYAGTAPAGSFAAGASPYGALDMAGNVIEWVSDFYAADAYARCAAPCIDPQGPAGGATRAGRGGSFKSPAADLRCSARGEGDPWHGDGETGFRCCGSL